MTSSLNVSPRRNLSPPLIFVTLVIRVAPKRDENDLRRGRNPSLETAAMRFLLWLLGALWLAGGILLAAPPRVMFVGAHPDDDSGATAYLASMAAAGSEVSVVTLSRGEGGGNAVGQESGEALGRLREREERSALGRLGIREIRYLDKVDWAYTTSYSATATRWDADDTRARLTDIMRELRPDVVITMNPYPSGHGHHQFAARMATEAYFASGIPGKLIYALSYGQEGFQPDFVHTPTPVVAALELEALRLYASQGWASLPGVGPAFVLGPEAFSIAHDRAQPRTLRQQPAVSVELAPTPEVADYRDWALSLGLDPVLAPPAARVVAGKPSPVVLEITNRGSVAIPMEVVPPPGEGVEWLDPARPLTAPPGRTRELFTAWTYCLGAVPVRGGTLQSVPGLSLPAEGVALTERWEGAESGVSGRFWLRLSERKLHLRVEVQDQAVVSQIAPGDKAGHWRTDAIELAIDPSGRSENTLSTFKLGIIPFATDGKPIAFRDADARPGPVDGLEVSSRRTTDGYVVEAAVPLAEIGSLAPEFGLNVLVYDADDLSAPVGANINLSRIGWSAWPEVMGNPRLWGRVSLEGKPGD